MNASLTIRLVAISAIAALFVPAPARAVITAVTPSPSSRNVPLGRSVSTPVTWTVTTAAGPFVTSTQGIFETTSGTTLGTINTTLTRPAAAGATVRISDTIRIPSVVMQRALNLGVNNFRYRRDFQDGDGTPGQGSGFVSLFITGSSGAGFAISSLALNFDDDQPVKLAPAGQPLRAKVELTFTGTGFLRADWDIATPASTLGVAQFLTLRSIRVYLTGSRTMTLLSPDLPTTGSGQYLVRFRITEPRIEFETPTIRYQVQGDDAGTGGALRRALGAIRLAGPPDRSSLSITTEFGWSPVAGSRAYQLEFYEKEEVNRDPLSQPPPPGKGDEPAPSIPERRVTGMIVSSGEAGAVLSSLSREHLRPGGVYLWRVIAIGPGGNVIGESAMREIQIPLEAEGPSPD